jgi:hypothetical protein
MKYNYVGEGTYVSGLVFEAAGKLVGSTQAASVLANFASSYIQVAALAANPAFSDDFEMIIYAPPTEELPGRFHTQKSCLPNPPAAKLRTMSAEDMMEVMQAFQAHRYEGRLHHAMAYFRIALNSLQLRFWVLAAEHLFIATENPIEEIAVKGRLAKNIQCLPPLRHRSVRALLTHTAPTEKSDT